MLPSPLVLFTEPLGLLLRDGRPAWSPAEQALAELARRKVPLIFASRGTRMELEFLRRKLGNRHPFLSESGGALFIPHGYFSARLSEAITTARDYHAIVYARPYHEVTAALEEMAAETGVEAVGFHQMSARETAENAGLPPKIAQLARTREFDEPFFIAGETPEAASRFQQAARARGFQCWRGDRFWHLASGADIARGVRRLLELYRDERHARVRAIAIGSRASELPVLAAVHQPILLPSADGNFDSGLLARLPGARRAAHSGPAGWNEVVLELLSH